MSAIPYLEYGELCVHDQLIIGCSIPKSLGIIVPGYKMYNLIFSDFS